MAIASFAGGHGDTGDSFRNSENELWRLRQKSVARMAFFHDNGEN
jgi:hypothetical protein